MKRLRFIETGIIALLFAIFTGFLLCGFLDSLESRTLNWRFRMHAEEKSKSNIVLVLITDECLSRLGTWPLSRSLYASVIDKIAAADARAIAFDIVFEENSTADSKGDKAFIASCLRYGRVILPLVFSEMQVFTNLASSPVMTEEARLPFKSLSEVAAGFGYINADFGYLNPDGVIQKTFLLHKFENHWISNYSLAIAEHVFGQQVVVSDDGVKFRDQALPLIDLSPWKSSDSSWQRSNSVAIYINYLGTLYHEHFRTYSFADIIENSFDSADFRDAVVLVGPSAVGLGDLKLTPYGLTPGVVIHANLLDNILAGNFLESPSLKQKVTIIAVFAFFTFCILCWEGAFVLSTIIYGLVLSVYVIYCFVAFSGQKLVLPMTLPLLMSVSQYITIRFLQLILHLKRANASLSDQNIELDQKVNELMALHGAGLQFPSILETSILSRAIIDKFCELYGADAGLLVRFEADTGQPCLVGGSLAVGVEFCSKSPRGIFGIS